MSIKQLRRLSQVKSVHLEVERPIKRISKERKPVPTTVSVEVQGTGSLKQR